MGPLTEPTTDILAPPASLEPGAAPGHLPSEAGASSFLSHRLASAGPLLGASPAPVVNDWPLLICHFYPLGFHLTAVSLCASLLCRSLYPCLNVSHSTASKEELRLAEVVAIYCRASLPGQSSGDSCFSCDE